MNADLGCTNFVGADLRHADMTSARLYDSDFIGANLEGACLKNASMGDGMRTGARFRGVDLRFSNMTWACVETADFRDANLQGATLLGTVAHAADFTGANLQAAYLRNAKLQGSILKGACLRAAVLIGAELGGADISGADLHLADMREATLNPLPPEEWVKHRDYATRFMADRPPGDGFRPRAESHARIDAAQDRAGLVGAPSPDALIRHDAGTFGEGWPAPAPEERFARELAELLADLSCDDTGMAREVVFRVGGDTDAAKAAIARAMLARSERCPAIGALGEDDVAKLTAAARALLRE
jgi:uncharacterized protein YjbI with pentapeptide repeats